MYKRILIGITVLIIAMGNSIAITPSNISQFNNEPTLIASVNFMNTDMLLPVENIEDVSENLQLIVDLLKEANRHMGTRYKRGGKSPNGFDCSGFTGYIYRQFGYNLSASSRGQYNDGFIVADDEVKPGDLLFFKGSSSTSIGHVAIAIDTNPETGDITFIHAAIKGGIRVDRISTPYYSKRFVGARRVIN